MRYDLPITFRLTRIATCLVVAGLLTLSSPDIRAEQQAVSPETQKLEEMFNGFFKVGLDTEHPLQVANLAFKKDCLELTLTRGTLYLAKPLDGEVTGAFFSGEGRMKVTLPNAMEKKSLKRWTDKDGFDEAITTAVFRFIDGSDKILADAKPGGAPVPDAQSTWEGRSKIDYHTSSLQLDFMDKHLGGVQNRPFFTVEAKPDKGKWVYFEYSEGNRMEVSLLGEVASGAASKRYYEPWSRFHKMNDYDPKGNYNLMPEADKKDVAALRDVTMSVEIPNTKSVLIDAVATAESLVDGLGLLRFSLVNNLDASSWDEKGRPVEVTSVTDASGANLPYIHKWHELIVLLPKPLKKGEKMQVRVKATEDTIIQLTLRSYYIYTTYPWFPQMGYDGGRYTFDWNVKIVKPLTAAGSGELVRTWEEGKMNCSQWRSKEPVSAPSFIFGEFEKTDGAYKREAPGVGEVPLHVYTIPGPAGGNIKTANILFNVAQGIKAYESLLGPFPYPDLDITQMSAGMGFSQSPPGILFLSSVMAGSGGGGMADQVLFHELAHQYWGNQVGWVGPEDEWISESWAEYSSGLITEAIDPGKFAAMRKEWKRRAKEGDHEATIATAYRSEWREQLLYNKGPYVAHMLRSWMGWDNFKKLALGIQTKYKGQNINTDTIAREASAIMGYSMFPFFDQWVRDTGIPRIHYSWTTSPSEDGKILVTIKTHQEDASSAKIMMVPIAFDFGKENPVVVTKPIQAADFEIKLKVPAQPKEIRMDDDGTQLADFIHDK